MLCQNCNDGFRGLAKVKRGAYRYCSLHHANSSSLVRSAKNGCPVCVRVSLCADRHLRHREPGVPDRYVRSVHRLFQHSDEARLPGSLTLLIDLVPPDGLGNHNLAYSVTPMTGVSHVLWKDPPPNNFSESDESLVQAQNWIRHCISSHRECSQGGRRSPETLPSRLLHIENGPPSTIRLVDVHNGENIEYLALSYCWGAGEIYKLTGSTVDVMRSGIPTSTLQKTYRDAVVVAQRLGISKLWIDALCIFQDSPESWRTESSKMHHIYQNSVCCISATSASDASAGLLHDREPRLVNSFTATPTVRGVAEEETEYMFIPYSDWNNEVNNAPLSSRGWALQERLLSRRVLHFGRDQLYWECRELDASESFPDGLGCIRNLCSGNTGFKGLDPETDGEELRLVVKEGHPELNVYRLWNRIVETYSSCDLTKCEDKLVAILGIARYLMTHMRSHRFLAGSGILSTIAEHSLVPTEGDGYIAGLWVAVLPFQLMWGTVCSNRRDDYYIAPSWSWASVDTYVWYDGFSGDPIITIINMGATPVGDDSMGQISDGYIRLRGYLLEPSKFDDELEWAQGLEKGRVNFDETGDNMENVSCLPVLRHEHSISGLILKSTTRGQYVRVGIFSTNIKSTRSGEEILQSINKLYDPPPELFEKESGDTICLI